MAEPTGNYEEFQTFIWNQLPVRKHKVGRERVNDILAVVVQEWPDDQLSACKSGESPEVHSLDELVKTVKRHLALSYGEEKFGSLWMLALSIIIPQIIQLVLAWWRRKKGHQGRLRVWRRKWVNG